MMLDFLCLVAMTGTHLLCSHTFKLLLQPLFLVCKSFECQYELLDLIFSFLKHLLLLAHITIKALSLTTTLLLIAT